jgi:hypothetical protein
MLKMIAAFEESVKEASAYPDGHAGPLFAAENDSSCANGPIGSEGEARRAVVALDAEQLWWEA